MRARGVDIKTGKVVGGYHCGGVKDKHFIIDAVEVEKEVPIVILAWHFTEIHPDSLALDTGVRDRECKAIFGSYPVDGAMSKGGDIFKITEGPTEVNDVTFEDGRWTFKEHGLYLAEWHNCGEIIGSQWRGK